MSMLNTIIRCLLQSLFIFMFWMQFNITFCMETEELSLGQIKALAYQALGEMHLRGEGTPKDLHQAVLNFEKAAYQEDCLKIQTRALIQLGMLYYFGLLNDESGGKIDYYFTKAYRSASELGLIELRAIAGIFLSKTIDSTSVALFGAPEDILSFFQLLSCVDDPGPRTIRENIQETGILLKSCINRTVLNNSLVKECLRCFYELQSILRVQFPSNKLYVFITRPCEIIIDGKHYRMQLLKLNEISAQIIENQVLTRTVSISGDHKFALYVLLHPLKNHNAQDLLAAINCEKGELICLLIEHEGDASYKFSKEELFTLVCTNNVPLISQLIGITNENLFQLLAGRSIIPSDKDEQGLNCLHYFVQGGVQSCVKLLLEKGFDVNVASNKLITALHVAAQLDSVEMIALLLSYKGDPTLRDSKNRIPLHYAATAKIALELLTSAPHTRDMVDIKGKSSLFRVASKGKPAVVKMLLMRHADSNLKSNKGWYAIHKAAKKGYLEIVTLLAEYNNGKSLNLTIESKDGLNGYSALDIAKSYNNSDDFAKKQDREDIVQLLSKLGCISKVCSLE